MDNIDILEKQKFIFGSLFLIPNKLQIVVDKGLEKYDITSRQWFLMAVLEKFFDSPPTLSELADAMGSSRQNVKQIALKLQKKGFVNLEKDKSDARAMRIKLTEKCNNFWEKRNEETKEFLNTLFEGLDENELSIVCESCIKLTDKLIELEKNTIKEEQK